jgi:hypothetical protein
MPSTATIKKAIAEDAEKRRLQHGKRMALLTARITAMHQVSFALDELKGSLAEPAAVPAKVAALRVCSATLDRLLQCKK